MNTAMSTKRSFISVRHEAKPASGMLIALIAGIALLLLGIATNVSILAIVGFVPFVSAVLYYNGLFWAKRMDNAKARNQLSANWTNRGF